MSEDNAPKLRPHSNTVSAFEKPLNINTALSPPAARRNSEGSPRLPPPINISEPTPIEPSFDAKDGFFPAKKENEADNNDNHSIRSHNSNQQHENDTSTLLSSPGKTGRKSRSRASSITSNIINEIKESSTIQKVASKIKSRQHSADDSDNAPPDNSSSIAVSVPGVSGVYLANAKRNQDFHSLFRSVPEDDGLIEGKLE